jgi:molybdopterin biosynthesis enzyme
VMTGAVVPAGTACIIALQEYHVSGSAVTLKPEAKGWPLRNIQRPGQDGRGGACGHLRQVLWRGFIDGSGRVRHHE